MQENTYDCAIIGGGIAGLSLAICLAKANKKIILFEKKDYPSHKVCGEYISNESKNFLNYLGVNILDFNHQEITHLKITSPHGIAIENKLDIGGIGLSRYVLDQKLYELAIKNGVEIHTHTQVNQVIKKELIFEINTSKNNVQSKTVVGAFGKNSNMHDNKNSINNNQYIAVKYHIKTAFNKAVVEIHNFSGGYCGLSSIEDNKINMSYICKASIFKKYKNIQSLEKHVLSKNPFLKKYFDNANFIFDKPLTISKLHFEVQNPVSNHILLIGDSASNIAPLSGNGMSIALLSAKICSEFILQFLDNTISYSTLETLYTKKYYQHFSKRITVAKRINFLFGNNYFTDIAFAFLNYFPFVIKKLSAKIHGDPF